MKKVINRKIAIILAIAFILIGGLLSLDTLERKTDSGFIPLNTSDWSNISSGDHTIIYVGRPTCEQCVEFEIELKAFLETERESMYYFNTDENQLIKEQVIKEYNLISVPSLVVLTENDFYVITDPNNDVILEELSNLY